MFFMQMHGWKMESFYREWKRYISL